MASINPLEEMDEEEQFNQAFGEHVDIPDECREQINNIRTIDQVVAFKINSVHTARQFTDQAWQLLGGYIANSEYLDIFDLDSCDLNDQQMTSLFSKLVRSESLTEIGINFSPSFSVDGVRSMVTFLENSPELWDVNMYHNDNFNSECFELLVKALQNSSVKRLELENCNITNISALDTYNIPNLQKLDLNQNNIGREGCITISNLLQKEDTNLYHLLLKNTGIDDEGVEFIATSLKDSTKLKELELDDNNITDRGAEIIAASLKHNTTLERLSLENSNITDRGNKAFLKLFVDASSIDNTYNSNHTLGALYLDRRHAFDEMNRQIKIAYWENRTRRTHKAAGRTKVINYQLNSQKRKKLCELQDIEYTPGSIFADIEPILLPDILVLIGEEHGQSEFYTTLIHTAPDLLSYINREALIDNEMAKYTSQASNITAQITSLTQQLSIVNAKKDQLSRRREMIGQRISSHHQSKIEGVISTRVVGSGDKKRKVQR